MEFLIPGLILVGLMVYVSTKVKRSSEAAWAPEKVETKQYTIVKPHGVLHVLNGRAELLFEAYSREFGTGGASKTRVARIEIRAYDRTSVSAKVKELEASGTLLERATQTIGDRKYVMLDIEEPADVLKCRVLYKVGEREGKIFVLSIRMLAEADDEMRAKLDLAAESFVLN